MDEHFIAHCLINIEKSLLELFKSSSNIATKNDLKEMENRMAKTQAEIASDLRNAIVIVNKIGTETSKSLDLIKTLQATVANQTDASQELQDAADALETQLTVVDNLVPDAQPVPPVTS